MCGSPAPPFPGDSAIAATALQQRTRIGRREGRIVKVLDLPVGPRSLLTNLALANGAKYREGGQDTRLVRGGLTGSRARSTSTPSPPRGAWSDPIAESMGASYRSP